VAVAPPRRPTARCHGAPGQLRSTGPARGPVSWLPARPHRPRRAGESRCHRRLRERCSRPWLRSTSPCFSVQEVDYDATLTSPCSDRGARPRPSAGPSRSRARPGRHRRAPDAVAVV